MDLICPVILAGGEGSRLWPLSTPERPKQFIRIAEQLSLFQQALQRVGGSTYYAPIIVCQTKHKHLVEQDLVELNIKPSAIILEAKPRNTAMPSL